MKSPENNKWLDEALNEAIGSKMTRTDFEQWKQNHPEAVKMLTSRAGKQAASPSPLTTRRIIMKSSITKLAAAAIIVVIGLGILTFIDNDTKSGTVWAEVAQKVEASTGVIWRLRGTGSRDPNDDWPNGYKITWRSAAITRTDRYRDGQIYRTIYYNLDAKTVIGVLHDAKKYNKEEMSDERVQRARADKDRWTGPQGLVNCCLTLKHHALDQKGY
jgi:hypothetical protein